MDKIFGAITGDKDAPSASSLPQGNKGPGGASSLAGNLLGMLDNDDDRNSAANDAAGRAGSSGNADMFKSVLGSLMSNKDQVAKEDIDEEDAVKNHKKHFEGGDDSSEADSKSLGAAAAMQALKKFNSGEEDTKGASSGSPMQKFLSLAMAEASKLFDDKASSGKVASGTKKDDVVKQAGEMALKMFLKSQGGQASQGGGASGLMGMASKFLK